MATTNKKIYAHRGLWADVPNQNTVAAMLDAFTAGFGVEIDIRLNSEGELVTGHDSAQKFDWKEILCYKDRNAIAFHVKEKGLCSKLAKLIQDYEYLDFIIFGVSEEEMPQYMDMFGKEVVAFEYSAGDDFDGVYNCSNKNVWVAELAGKKVSKKEIILLKSLKKNIHLVMQDCHKGDPVLFGIRLINFYDGLLDSICTDSPTIVNRYCGTA